MKYKVSTAVQILFFLLMGMASVAQKSNRTLFTLLNSKQTNLVYLNEIKENDSLNVFRYEYLYNGAGIGVGDFNNDGLLDVFFSGNTAANKLFLNKGDFQFNDITIAAGVAGNGKWSTGVSIADVNGDGLLDIYVCHSGKYADKQDLRNELFINQGLKDGVPVFIDMAYAYGLDAPGTQSTQAAFFDYDGDGDLDMFLLNHSNHTYNPLLNTRKTRDTPHPFFGNRLFRNDDDGVSTKFTDVTLEAGIINHALNFGLSVTIADMNGDGWPDIYTTSDYTERDCLYLNNKNGTFRETLSASMAHIAKYAMGADIADYNNDGKPDVIVLDMLPEDNKRQKLLKGPDEYDQYHLLLDSGYYHQQMRNMLQLNRGVDEVGNVRFSEIGQLAGVSNTDWSWAPLLVDLDGDGWKDLVVTNGYLRDYTDMDFLKYTVADAKANALRTGNLDFQTADLVKQMPSNKLKNYVFQNNKDLSFIDQSDQWGFSKLSISNAAIYADLDNDGDIDIIICNNNEPALVYRNNLTDNKNIRYLKVRLKGDKKNTQALGAKLSLTTSDGNVQYQELYPVRGYQSSVSPELHFLFPVDVNPVQLDVIWPDGKRSSVNSFTVNSILDLDSKERSESIEKKPLVLPVFKDVTAYSGVQFKHIENDFIDFKGEVLLPYQLSRQGPALTKGDINGDGLEDLFVGGAIGQPGALFFQNADGTFTKSVPSGFVADKESEDVNAVFFDADNDGDLDLYVVSGGNEYDDGSPEYADRLYINDGKGKFSKLASALPSLFGSKEAIAVGDFDKDGYMDVFVGGKTIAGSFPKPASGYLLKNDSKSGTVRFKDITNEEAPFLRRPGIVNTALWSDLNGDGYPELIIAGDWMTPLIYLNENGQLKDITKKTGLQELFGMWSAVAVGDLNNDGLPDIVLGNCGLNNQFKASQKQPITLHVADFDNNGTPDPIMSYYIQGKSYPMASRDELLDQIPGLKRRFVKYKDYAGISTGDLFSRKSLESAMLLKCTELASGVLINKGDMKFEFEPLPVQAQFSRVYGIGIGDYTGGNSVDLLLNGNFFPYRTQLGQSDAGLGVILKNEAGKWRALDAESTGLFVGGDVRRMTELKNAAGETLVVIARNNDNVTVLKMNSK